MKLQNIFVKNYFANIRIKNTKIDSFFSFLDVNNIHYAVLGGAVRAALNNVDYVRDIDVIFQADNFVIYNFLSENNISYELNSFGGLKFNLGNIQFDAWNIENHYAFQKKTYTTKFENIYKTTFINYDSVMYDFTKDILYDEKYNSCINEKEIDLIGSKKLCNKNPNKPLSICKILELKQKYQYELSYKTKKYIKEFCKSCIYKKHCMFLLETAYERHYKKKMNKKLYFYIKKHIMEIFYS